MEEEQLKFSSRGKFICNLQRNSSSEPLHFLSREQWSEDTDFKCSVCRSRHSGIGNDSKYYLYCYTCELDVHRNCYFRPICRLSPITNPHVLTFVSGDDLDCYACGSKGSSTKNHYKCKTCKVRFHEVCHLYPPWINHPLHFLHRLNLTYTSPSSYDRFAPFLRLPGSWKHEPVSDSESEEEEEPEASDDIGGASISKLRCKCCQKRLLEPYYHCSVCNFNLNLTCTRNPPPLAIHYYKSHEHILYLFPRRISSPCDACGLSLENTHDFVYACYLCNFLIHKACTFLPLVIKITRHAHRLSLSASLPSGSYSCGVCRHPVDVTYGQFSCNKGCPYAVHSRCAVAVNVWDGKDLVGVPEEPDNEDIEPFVRIDEETIKHSSHDHNLKFHTNSNIWDENRFCQACILPVLVYEEFYGCAECPFLLHEACASFPRKKDHPLHQHRLVLHPISPKFEGIWVMQINEVGDEYNDYIEGMFKCDGCSQISYGFMYICSEKYCDFKLDARCASLLDPFVHGSHPHDLFFNLTKGECMGCKSSDCSPYSVECMECKSFLGLKCATMPSKAYYKHDKHPLTLCYGEDNNGECWCEICERRLDTTVWFYTCNDYCNVTVHATCLLGSQIFLKPASFELKGNPVSIVRNNYSTRLKCYRCRLPSVEPFLFKSTDYSLCSYKCIWRG